MTLYVIRDERSGVVHLASGVDPLGTMLCGAVVAKWYPISPASVGRNTCHRCAVERDRRREQRT